MKLLSVISATVFCVALLSWPARADEPQAIKLAPQIQAMLSELLKTADGEPVATAAPANLPSTSPAAVPAATPVPFANGNQPATGLRTSSLGTSNLRISSLMTSAPLGGHGLTGGTPRLTDAEWRQQFPARK